MGTYIEDFEYVEGLGDLDKYNGRFCVTPEYPEGVYAYFCTLDGTTGNPKFPYFIGPDFYSQADNINWNEMDFNQDSPRTRFDTRLRTSSLMALLSDVRIWGTPLIIFLLWKTLQHLLS